MIHRYLFLFLALGSLSLAQSKTPYQDRCEKPRKFCNPAKNSIVEWIIGEVKDSPNRCWWTCDATLSATFPEKIEASNSCYEFTNKILMNEGWGTFASVNKSANLVSRSVRMFRETNLPLVSAQSFRPSSKKTKLLGRTILTRTAENPKLPDGEKLKWIMEIKDDRDEAHADKPQGSFQRTYQFRTHGDTCELESVHTIFKSKTDSHNSNEFVNPEICRDTTTHQPTSVLQLCAEVSNYFPAVVVDKPSIDEIDEATHGQPINK